MVHPAGGADNPQQPLELGMDWHMPSVHILTSEVYDWKFTSKSFQLGNKNGRRAKHTIIWLCFSSLLDADENFMLVAIWEPSTI